MKAIVTQSANHFTVKDMPKPELRPGCVLMRPLAVSLCLTEKRQFMGILGCKPDFILGHEVCAVVEAVADDVVDFKPGDRVAPIAGGACGECLTCQSGLLNCAGGFWDAGFLAEYAVKPARTLYKLPDTVSNIAGASVEPYSCGYRAIRQSGICTGDNVVVLGLQDYTWGLMQLLKRTHLTQIVAIDPLPKRRELAEKLGIDVVLDPTACDVAAEVKKLMPYGADVCFVSMEEYLEPSMQYMDIAAQMCRNQGTILNLMHYMQATTMGVLSWTKELKIQYRMGFGEEPILGGHDRSDYALTIDAMAKGQLVVDPLVPEYAGVYKFSELNTEKDVCDMYAAMVDKNLKTYVTFD